MATARIGHTATLLPNGKVLIAGGQTPGCCVKPLIFSSAELYDPSTGSFSATGEMTTPRSGHTATLLPNGKVLIAGGPTAELYDPATGTFSATGNMVKGSGGTPILLEDGTVLIAHGRFGPNPATAELYDPVTGTFSGTGDQLVICCGGTPTAALVPDGRVLLVICCTEAQLYDPASGAFSLTDSLTDRTRRIYGEGFGAAALTNGTVLFTGGYSDLGFTSLGAELYELYDSSSGSFRPTGNMTTARFYHTVTPLSDGTVLIAGGVNDFARPTIVIPASTTAEIYDPATGTFSRTGDMTNEHIVHTATLLLDGRVLLTGGYTSEYIPASAELYIPSILVPVPVVGAIRFDRTVVPAGSSYSVDLSGSNLTQEMFFDVRFTGPESNQSVVVLNWQKGLVENHEVPAGIALGSWTITDVRAHKIETDHTGIFFPVSATIIVSP